MTYRRRRQLINLTAMIRPAREVELVAQEIIVIRSVEIFGIGAFLLMHVFGDEPIRNTYHIIEWEGLSVFIRFVGDTIRLGAVLPMLSSEIRYVLIVLIALAFGHFQRIKLIRR